MRLTYAAAALGLLLAPGVVRAQDFQRIAPQTPPAAPAPVVQPPPAPAPAPETVVLHDLRGVAFVPGASAVQPNGVATPGVTTNGIALLDDPAFTAQIAPFLGKPLTLADLQTIARLTNDWFRAHQHPFVSVTVPPQNVSAGTVQVVVAEYRVGAVRVEGNQWFSSDLLTRESGIVPGQTLTLPALQADLDWLNSNPFRTVNAVFQPGGATAETDVVLKTQDRLPAMVYASFDNAGVKSLGLGEWSLGATWGNAFGQDQLLSYRFTRAVSGRYDAHAVSYTVPLPWRDRILVFGSFEQETPEAASSFDNTGQSGQASIRYVHSFSSLALAHGIGLTSDVQIGYDFKTTDSNLEFGGTQVFASQAEIDQFPLILNVTQTDIFGQTAFENQLVPSPGNMTASNNTAAFRAIVPGSAANYVYDRIGLTRTTFLPQELSWVLRVVGQVSNRNLLDSEQLGAGGPDSVRGYYTDTALGSEGVLVSNEIRSPVFSVVDALHVAAPVKDAEQLGVFWDYGHVTQVQSVPGAVNGADLSSVGFDVHATLDRYVDVRYDLGAQLRNAPGTNKRGVFGDVAVVLRY